MHKHALAYFQSFTAETMLGNIVSCLISRRDPRDEEMLRQFIDMMVWRAARSVAGTEGVDSCATLGACRIRAA